VRSADSTVVGQVRISLTPILTLTTDMTADTVVMAVTEVPVTDSEVDSRSRRSCWLGEVIREAERAEARASVGFGIRSALDAARPEWAVGRGNGRWEVPRVVVGDSFAVWAWGRIESGERRGEGWSSGRWRKT
jgi:hypothetical protein